MCHDGWQDHVTPSADFILIDGSEGDLKKYKKPFITKLLQPVFILLPENNLEDHKKFLARGVAGVIPTGTSIHDIVNMIFFVKPNEQTELADRSLVSLNGKEEVILGGLMKGQSDKEMARDYGLALSTTKYHVRSICQKLGAKNRTHAALLAQKIIV